jgi:putative ABC transport system permease protein
MNVWHDIRYGARMLRKSPGFTLIAVLTLSVGIGVTGAVYSICDAMLWKPVALPHLETLVMTVERGQGGDDNWNPLTPGDFDNIRRESKTLENVAAWQGGQANIGAPDGHPEGVLRALVSANFFDAVGVKPEMGRAFDPGEDQPGREFVVILSHRLWEHRFGANPAVLGKPIRIDGRDFVVTGVMPDSFDFPLATELWMPNALKPEVSTSRQSNMLTALARLKPGHTLEQASAELDGLGARLGATYPNTNKDRRFMVQPALRFLVNYQRERFLLMLLAAILFVLLIACVNVANLQFARAQGRLREVALRSALGASRWRVILMLVTESLLLAVPSAALGLLVAHWGMTLIKAGMPAELVRFIHGWQDIRLDYRVLVFTLVVAALSAILAGMVPAWQCSRPNLVESLKEGGRGGSAGGSRHLLRNVLVAVEITLAVVLLVGAGLMVRGFRAQVDNGAKLEPASLLTMRLALSEDKYREPHQVAAFYRDVLKRVETVPGVRAAAAVSLLPYTGRPESAIFTIEKRPAEPGNVPRAMYQAASPSYFANLHIPLLGGRLLNEGDGPDAPKVALVSERLAAQWWGSESPVGQRIRSGDAESPGQWFTVVGVVGDILHSPYDRQPRPAIYVPFQQSPALRMDLALRAEGDPLLLAPAITAAIHEVDEELLVTDIRTMEKAIHNQAIGLNYMAALMGVFGLLALGLSAIGVYGVMAHLVSEQGREIGIRIALGARRSNIIALILRRAMLPILVGLAIGLPLAWAFSRLLASSIYGVTSDDAATFLGVPAALVAAALVATLSPARRATKIDPIVALRSE